MKKHSQSFSTQTVYSRIFDPETSQDYEYITSKSYILKYIKKMQISDLQIVIKIMGYNKAGKSTLANEMINFYERVAYKKIGNGLFSRDQQPRTAFKTLYFCNSQIEEDFFEYGLKNHNFPPNFSVDQSQMNSLERRDKEQYIRSKIEQSSFRDSNQNQRKFLEEIYMEFQENAKGVDKNSIFIGKVQNLYSYFHNNHSLQMEKLKISIKNLNLIEKLHDKRRSFIEKINRDNVDHVDNKIQKQHLLKQYCYLVLSSNLQILKNSFLSKYTCISDTSGTDDNINARQPQKSQIEHSQRVEEKKEEEIESLEQREIDSHGDIYVYVHNVNSGVNNNKLKKSYFKLLNQKNPSKIIICYNFSTFWKQLDSNCCLEKEELKFLQMIFKTIPNDLIEIFTQTKNRFVSKESENCQKDTFKREIIFLREIIDSLDRFSQAADKFIIAKQQKINDLQSDQEMLPPLNEGYIGELIRSLFNIFPHENLFFMASDWSKIPLYIQQFFKKSEEKYTETLVQLTKKQLQEQYKYLNRKLSQIKEEVQIIQKSHSDQLNQEEIQEINLIKNILKGVSVELGNYFQHAQTRIQKSIESYLARIQLIFIEIKLNYHNHEMRSNYAFKQSIKEEITAVLEKGINKATEQYNNMVLSIQKEYYKLLSKHFMTNQILNKYMKEIKDLGNVQKRIRLLLDSFNQKANIMFADFIEDFNTKWTQFLKFNFQAFNTIGINLKLICAAFIGSVLVVLANVGFRVAIAFVGLPFFIVASSITGVATIGYISFAFYSNHKKRKAIDEKFFRDEWKELIKIQNFIGSKCEFFRRSINSERREKHQSKFRREMKRMIELSSKTVDNQLMDRIKMEIKVDEEFIKGKINEILLEN